MHWQEYVERYGMESDCNIIEDAHLGIINGHITTNTWHSNVLSLRGLYAPPFAGSNFVLDGWIYGETVKTQSYSWLPFQVRRQGKVRQIEVESTLTLVAGERAFILELQLHNVSDVHETVPLQFDMRSGLDYVTSWDFLRPTAEKSCELIYKNPFLMLGNDTGAIVIGTHGMRREAYMPYWKTELKLRPGQKQSFWLVLAMGETDQAQELAARLLENPALAVQQSCEAERARTELLLGRLPRLQASNKLLEKFYDRSALHFLLNQWNVSEFLLHPYYSTGSIIGGCVCSYLWDFGSGWELFPLVDPGALREHVKTFLRINLTRHFAFNPISGAGWGPWYYINQEKIIYLIHYYVQITGDRSFLDEKVNDKSVLEWVVYYALWGDRLEEEANLIDYGNGNHHLELRREYRYDHFLPDMNARRYPLYYIAQELCQLMDHRPEIDFAGRAEKLKQLIHDELWDDEQGWWFFKDNSGEKHLRYTIQLFKLIGSGAIDDAQERTLISHLNEREFLSEFGMHSMSKLDPAYDQIDIDNGGGGACSIFPPQIAERLYKAGYREEAEDILQRILWWGERLPYWGDSLVANVMDYRKDTPLQNAVGAVSGAQAIIFGMFGLSVDFNGDVTFNPAPPSYSRCLSLTGLQVRGMVFDIHIDGDLYEVRTAHDIFQGKVGQPITISTAEKN